MPRPLTKKQKQILDFIIEFIKGNDYPPSYREIAGHFGISSTATIYEHVKNLEEKGYLKSTEYSARSLELIEDATIFKKAIELPLVGLIAAGEPIQAIENREMIAVPETLIRDPRSFVLQVKGSSMVEDGILDGDYVIVERNFYPQNGDVVVALLENEYATLKRYYREKNSIRLQPANKSMKPIYVENPVIQGVVRAVMRKFSSAS
ncbi:MAG: transcriptional repressor LexA [Parcubacteria group bacterium]|nr:transcriptional repressor LexA [Parcubacteria group bacterium]